MVGLSGLWMPIALSAVAVFIASSLIHMVIGWHRAEYQAPPNEPAIADALRPFNLQPGEYHMPWAADMKAMGTPEFQDRLKRGPNITMIVRPNAAGNMGKMLGQWFVYTLIVSVFAAYLTGRALGQGADYMSVFRFAGTAAFTGYVLALWQFYVWFGKSMRYMITSSIDGLIYALLTAGIFGWLWPR